MNLKIKLEGLPNMVSHGLMVENWIEKCWNQKETTSNRESTVNFVNSLSCMFALMNVEIKLEGLSNMVTHGPKGQRWNWKMLEAKTNHIKPWIHREFRELREFHFCSNEFENQTREGALQYGLIWPQGWNLIKKPETKKKPHNTMNSLWSFSQRIETYNSCLNRANRRNC